MQRFKIPIKACQFLLFFPECVAKGSRLTLEVWRLESCSPSVARATETVRNGSQRDRNEVAKPHQWVALTKCDKDDVLEVDFLANSMLLLRFVTRVAVAFAFCVAGAIL